MKTLSVLLSLLIWTAVGAGVSGVEWDVANLHPSDDRLDTSGKTSNTRCMVLFDNDTMLLVHSRGGKNVVTYRLAEPGVLATAEFVYEFDTSPHLGTGARSSQVGHGIYIKPGSFDRVWLWNRTELWEFTLSIPGDMSTAVQSGYRNFAGHVARGHAIDFHPDGTFFYVDDRAGGRVRQYRLEQPWDIDTMELVAVLDISARHDEVRGLEFNPDGSRMYLLDTKLRELQQYSLAEPWMIESAQLEATVDLPVRNPRGITWNSAGDRVYIVDASTGIVRRFDVLPPAE